MESRWEGILASIFCGFWWIFGGKLGRKMEPRSIQEGIEKAMEKWIASRWPKSRNKPLRSVAEPGVQSPGEGLPLLGQGNPSSPPRRCLDAARTLPGRRGGVLTWPWLGLALAWPSWSCQVPSWAPLGSVWPPNLAPQIHQNRRNIDAKTPSHVDLIF